MPAKYSGSPFIRDYDASSLCAAGQHPVWRLYSWTAITPEDSQVSFSIATASTLAGLATATPYALEWSAPPGVPANLAAGQPAIAHAGSASPPAVTDTEIGGASPDATLLAHALPQNNYYLRVVAALLPSTDKVFSPTLASWDMQIDCVDNE